MYVVLPEGRPWRSWVAVAVALAIHAAVGSFTYVIARTSPPEIGGPGHIAAETEVEIDESAPGARAEAPVEPRDERASSEQAGLEPRIRRRPSTPSASEQAPSPGSARPGTEPSGQGGPEGYALDPTAPARPPSDGPRVELGIGSGDWSRWVDPTARVEAPPPPRPERTPAPASSTGGLAEALEAHDREVGLGPAGPILTAAREAGHSDVAPAIGTAAFTITVLRTGAIHVDLVGASSNAEGWRKVAENMALAIQRKPPRIEGGRNGVRIGLELVAQERWPNGAVARSEGPALAISGGSIRPTDASIEDLSKRNPLAVPPPGSPAEQPQIRLNIDPPGVWVKGRGKVCGYKVGVTPLGPMLAGGCDPSNIGARAQRVVSAKVTNQSML